MDNSTKLYTIPRGRAICKFVFALLCCVVLSLICISKCEAQEPYVVISSDETTLTFYFDDEKNKREGTIHTFEETNEIGKWPWIKVEYINGNPNIKNPYQTVVFDNSFWRYSPTSCSEWFAGCSSLTEIIGLENLNTSDVEDMSNMFSGCEILTKIDLSHFDTRKVTNMSFMFEYCWELSELDLSSFNTKHVTNMLDMFLCCGGLRTIKVSTGWSIENVTNGNDMFVRCDVLSGENGTSYNQTDNDISFAHVDGDGGPGYLTLSIDAYAVLSDDGTFTLYYDENKGANDFYCLGDNKCLTKAEDVTKVVFNESFDNYYPTNCDSWFYAMKNLTEIVGINEHLNTDNVTSMSYMFYNCSQLTELDLSHLVSNQVVDMSNMFAFCGALKTINISGFNTSQVTNMYWMFCNCINLETIEIGEGWKTDNVQSMSGLFAGCTKLKFDLNKLNTQSVEYMDYMLNSWENITEFDLRSFNTQKVISMQGMFAGCRNLERIIINPEIFNTENVEDMGWMFSNCNKLSSRDLPKFNTNSAMKMNNMFTECTNLEILDLRSFNTEKVVDMREMFSNCENLTTILVDPKKWIINVDPNATFYYGNSEKNIPPFENTPNLIGDKGTQYKENSYDYAKVDDPSNGKPGYLTTDSYKIFYDLNGGEWDGEQGANEFALSGRTEDIIIPYPKKAGFIFDGWTGTLASGLSDTQPIKDVTITTDQKGNRIYTAHWKNVDENEIEISYPQTDQEREVYCDLHQDKSITLELKTNEIRDVYYQIAIEELNINIEGNSLYNNSGYEIPITLPAKLTSNEYTGSINLFSSSDSKEPILKYKLTIKLLMPQNLILHLYEDVIFVSNGDSLYNPYKWQWYKNGQPINGATRQYIYDNEMSGNTYMCKMQTKDGLEVYTCPFTEPSLTKSLSQSVTIAPNPASEGEPTNVKIANFDPETDYTITISNSNGVVVRTIYHANENNTINLNSGIYSGALIFNGNKKGFKLIVR